MQVIDILVLAIIFAVILQFWQLRKQDEAAVRFAKHYCDSNNIQYIACARIKTRLSFFKRNLIAWRCDYLFEFSGNGEDKTEGHITLENHKLINITADAYRI